MEPLINQSQFTYLDGVEGINPRYTFVKDRLGRPEKQESLSSRWVLSFKFLEFLPEDNFRQHRLKYFNEDLILLLRLKHHIFWSQVVFDQSFHKFLDSFLIYAKRPGSTTASQQSLFEDLSSLDESKEANEANNFFELSPSHKTLYRNVLSIIVRICSPKESTTAGFGSAKVHGDLVYGILDFPRLVDFVSLFSRFNFNIVTNIVKNLFSIQPKYGEELSKSVTACNQVILEISRQLSKSLKAALNDGKKDYPSKLTQQQVEQAQTEMRNLMLTCEDLSNYIVDITYSFSSFCKVYPPAVSELISKDSFSYFALALRALVPGLILPITAHSEPEYQRRHIATRNHALSILNKIISQFMFVLGSMTSNEGKEWIIESANLNNFKSILTNFVETISVLLMTDKQLVHRVSRTPEDTKLLSWLLLEEEAEYNPSEGSSSSNRLKDSVDLNSSFGLKDQINPNAFFVVFDLENKYFVLSKLKDFADVLNSNLSAQLADSKALVASFGDVIKNLESMVVNTPVRKHLGNNQKKPEGSKAATGVSMEELQKRWKQAETLATEIKEIFPDFESGFVCLALVEHYNLEKDRLIHDLLESNLSPACSEIDKKISLEDAKVEYFSKNSTSIISNDLDKKAELPDVFEQEGRFKMDTSHVVMGRAAKSSKNSVSFSEAMKGADKTLMVEQTMKLVQLQQKRDEEREYETQLKRARGQHVDEEEEELFSQLKRSQEMREEQEALRESNSSFGMSYGYEDEPDDSLDDFHPVGMLADADHDSKLSITKRRNHPISYGVQRSKNQGQEFEEEEEEEEEDDYGGDLRPASAAHRTQQQKPQQQKPQQQKTQQQPQHQKSQPQKGKGQQQQQHQRNERTGLKANSPAYTPSSSASSSQNQAQGHKDSHHAKPGVGRGQQQQKPAGQSKPTGNQPNRPSAGRGAKK